MSVSFKSGVGDALLGLVIQLTFFIVVYVLGRDRGSST